MFANPMKSAAGSLVTCLGCLSLSISGCSRADSPAVVDAPRRYRPTVVTAEYQATDALHDPVQFAVYTEETSSSDAETGVRNPCSDWPRPQLALVLTGRQHGYIEPCGCTGLENAKGGLSRRHSLVRQLQARGWDVVLLDVGNQVRRFGKQAEIKFQTTISSLRTIGYDAIGFGPDDLRLSIGELAAAVMGDGDGRGPFVCANVNVFGENKPYVVLERSGIRIGVTGILGTREQSEISSDEIELTDPFRSLERVVPEMLAKKCNLYVLLAHTSLEESRELARRFPQFGIVATAGGAGEPTMEPETLNGSRARLIQVGTKGMYVGVVGLFPKDSTPLRYERVSLDARFPDSPEMLDAFALYQKQLENLGFKGLGIRPVKHSSRQGTYVGHEVCGECHTKAYEIFENTPHFHATDSISDPTERSSIPRHHDPECVSCHVTGWDPQGYFPYVSGYWGLEESRCCTVMAARTATAPDRNMPRRKTATSTSPMSSSRRCKRKCG